MSSHVFLGMRHGVQCRNFVIIVVSFEVLTSPKLSA